MKRSRRKQNISASSVAVEERTDNERHAPSANWARQSPEETQAVVESILRDLAEIRSETQLGMPFDAERPKHALAFEALRLAGLLVNAVAGWAVNHKLGLVLAQKESPPPFIGLENRDKEFEKFALEASSHGFEIVGKIGIPLSNGDYFARLATIEILSPLATGMGDFPPFVKVIDALTQLEHGTKVKFFEPSRDNHQRTRVQFKELLMQAQALDFVEYFSNRITVDGIRANRSDAQEKVAKAMGVDTSTLRTWKHRHAKQFPRSHILGRRNVAREAASCANANISSSLMEYFNEERLFELGSEYKSFQKSRAAKKRIR